MARSVAMMAFGIVVGVIAGAAGGTHAADGGGMGGSGDLTGTDGSGEGLLHTPSAEPDLTVEAAPAQQTGPPYGAAVARAQCIIGKESGGADVPNRQGSGATGPGQYMPGTWVRHVALYRQATGYQGPLSLHSYNDVLAVMSWILSAIPSTRREWTVGGC